MREAELMLNGVDAAAAQFGRFPRGQPAEVAHLDDFGFFGIAGGEESQDAVKLEELPLLSAAGNGHFQMVLEFGALPAASTLRGGARARVIDEHAAHDAGGKGQEMGAGRKFVTGGGEDAEVGFIDQRGRLQGVVATFGAEVAPRDAMQLGVDQWDEFFGRRGIALLRSPQKRRDLALQFRLRLAL